MNILEEIVTHKKLEVQRKKEVVPLSELENVFPFFSRSSLSLKEFLLDMDRSGIIAEFKRKSPSKGIINDKANVKDVTSGYGANGASGLSILTDNFFFGGTNEDIITSRGVDIPILRKEFIIDEYQIVEAKAIGADAILLIAAILTPAEVKDFTAKAHELGLEVILEIHNEAELNHITNNIDIVGVNNRNLKTFEVDMNCSARLSSLIGSDMIKISESGIHSINDISFLKEHGYNGFLIGENFMKQPDPGAAFLEFANSLKEMVT